MSDAEKYSVRDSFPAKPGTQWSVYKRGASGVADWSFLVGPFSEKRNAQVFTEIICGEVADAIRMAVEETTMSKADAKAVILAAHKRLMLPNVTIEEVRNDPIVHAINQMVYAGSENRIARLEAQLAVAQKAFRDLAVKCCLDCCNQVTIKRESNGWVHYPMTHETGRFCKVPEAREALAEMDKLGEK